MVRAYHRQTQRSDGHLDDFGVRMARCPSLMKHATLAEYRACLGDELDEYTTFSVVRNPWDRLASWWHYNGARDSLAAFVRHKAAWGTQVDALSLDGALAVDHIIRYEALQGGFDAVINALGLPRAALPVTNRSKRPPYRADYDDEARALVGRLYAADVETFGYRF